MDGENRSNVRFKEASWLRRDYILLALHNGANDGQNDDRKEETASAHGS